MEPIKYMFTLTKSFIDTGTVEEFGLKSTIWTFRKSLPPQEDTQATLEDENLALFKNIYHQYEKRVLSTLIRLVGKSAAEDLAQETFFRIWKNLSKLKNVNSLSSWIYKITLNVAYDDIKKNIKERCNLSHVASDTSFSENEEMARRYEHKTAVERALRSLSLDHRSVLVMHDLEGVTEKEISTILDIPVGTVKSRLFYARDQVRTFLSKEGINHYEN